MDTKLALDKKASIQVNHSALMADLEKIEPILSLFPKLEKLTAHGAQVFETQLKPMGAMGVEHAVHYAATYELDKAAGKLKFKSKDGIGNASLSGEFDFIQKGGQTEVNIIIKGELRDIKVPMMLRPATPGFIKTMFEGVVDRLIQKIGEKYPA